MYEPRDAPNADACMRPSDDVVLFPCCHRRRDIGHALDCKNLNPYAQGEEMRGQRVQEDIKENIETESRWNKQRELMKKDLTYRRTLFSEGLLVEELKFDMPNGRMKLVWCRPPFENDLINGCSNPLFSECYEGPVYERVARREVSNEFHKWWSSELVEDKKDLDPTLDKKSVSVPTCKTTDKTTHCELIRAAVTVIASGNSSVEVKAIAEEFLMKELEEHG